MGSIPANLQWKTMDGTYAVMTSDLAVEILAEAAAKEITIFNVAEAHKLALESSNDPLNYNYLDGWPESFV